MGGHAARAEAGINSNQIFMEQPEEGDHFEHLGVDARIILKLISNKNCGVA